MSEREVNDTINRETSFSFSLLCSIASATVAADDRNRDNGPNCYLCFSGFHHDNGLVMAVIQQKVNKKDYR